MKFVSTNGKKLKVSLKEAIFKSIAKDHGLYLPEKISKLPRSFFQKIESLSFKEIALEVAHNLLRDSISKNELKKIIEKTITFDAPLKKVEEDIYALELFHGPTLAFKDFGARFLANLSAHFLAKEKKQITVLAATSGDTGSAVASGFFKVPNVRVILLYPSGKVSKIQEQQLTTMGHNIKALEIKGVFDDCQSLVKQAFTDEDLNEKLNLTSANSINLGRLLPQTFYYFYAYSRLKNKSKKLAISVPSGNFGNLTAGLIAKKMGLPITKFIASTNENDTFPKYLKTGKFTPKPSKKTISNAMDVGNPNNFPRITTLYLQNLEKIKKDIEGISFTDQQTRKAIKDIHTNSNYIMDPHGAIAYLGLKQYLKTHPDYMGIFLETAHPAKFADIVEPIIKEKIQIPARLKKYLTKKKISIKCSKEFKEFKNFLLTSSS